MTRRYTDMKKRIGYVDKWGRSIRLDWLVESDVVVFSTCDAGTPTLNMKQARLIAERILQWCDDAEKKQ